MSICIKREKVDVDVPSSSKRKPAPSTASKVSPGRQPRAKLTPKKEVFFEAAKIGNLKKLQQYIENGVDKEATNRFGFTALHIACEHGWLEIVEYLIVKCVVDIEARNHDDITALILASDRGHIDIVEYLVETGKADTNASDSDGCTALHSASDKGHKEIVKYLIRDAHADKDKKDRTV